MPGELVAPDHDWHAVLEELTGLLRDRFDIAHVTLQPEAPHTGDPGFRGCSLDSPKGRAACHVPTPSTPNGAAPAHRH